MSDGTEVSSSAAVVEATASDAKSSSVEDVVTESGEHRLEHTWVLWYDCPEAKRTARDYDSGLEQVAEFETVEAFWRHFNNLAPPSALSENANYHLFKKGITPTWEDAENANGGRWLLQLTRAGPVGTKTADRLDSYWENLVLGVIGETIDPTGAEVCGIVVSRRAKWDRLSLWTRDKNFGELRAIGHRMRALIAEGESKVRFSMHYAPHNDHGSNKNEMRIDGDLD